MLQSYHAEKALFYTLRPTQPLVRQKIEPAVRNMFKILALGGYKLKKLVQCTIEEAPNSDNRTLEAKDFSHVLELK